MTNLWSSTEKIVNVAYTTTSPITPARSRGEVTIAFGCHTNHATQATHTTTRRCSACHRYSNGTRHPSSNVPWVMLPEYEMNRASNCPPSSVLVPTATPTIVTTPSAAMGPYRSTSVHFFEY